MQIQIGVYIISIMQQYYEWCLKIPSSLWWGKCKF